MIEQSRRGFITGLISLVTAPAIVRASSLMPVKGDVLDWRKAVHDGMSADFQTDNLLVKAYERYATSYTVWGLDAWGQKISEKINIGQVGELQFKQVTGIISIA